MEEESMKGFLTLLLGVFVILFYSKVTCAHDRWLVPSKPLVKLGEEVKVEFCVGHGFESEAAPSEWWLTRFYHIEPDGSVNEIKFSYDKSKQKSATGNVKVSKKGTHMVYSVAENIYWVKTKDGRYLQFKDKINVDPSLIKRTFVGWQYSKTYFKVVSSGGDSYKKIMNSTIELVPLEDPTKLRVGDHLTLRILTNGEDTKWNVGVIAFYKGYPGGLWSYSFFTEYPGELYAKEGIDKKPIVKIPITHKGYWFVKAFRMMDREILCEGKYGTHDAYFFEHTLTFYVP